jgi:uncharacterized protein YndB with AHSA1/START domain
MLSVSRRIQAPPERLWQLLVDVEAWPRWGPSVAAVELSTPLLELGSRGRVRTAVGVWLPFEVTGLESGRSWAWSVLGVPATGHEVRPVDGGCVATFTVPWWAPGYLPVCAVALRRLEGLAVASAG